MAVVLNFPTIDDRQAIHSAVQVFLLTRKPHMRTRMIDAIEAILRRYHLSSMHVFDFAVGVTNEFVLISADRVITDNDRRCPACDAWMFGEDVSLLSEGRKRNRVFTTWGCHRCGSVFGHYEKGEVSRYE